MPVPRVLILRAPGTNCDLETAYAFDRAGASAERVHINRLLEHPQPIDAYQVLCIPGGFCYGDDISAGKILASQIRHHLFDILNHFRDQNRLILGICNGFQVLLKAGLLVEEEQGTATATLALNDSGRFEDRWVHLEVAAENTSVFLAGLDRLEMPVAHAEGKLVFRDADVLRRLASSGQIVLRYASSNGTTQCGRSNESDRAGSRPIARGTAGAYGDDDSPRTLPYPANPNGSTADIAGLCDSTGRVLGLMPHPERHLDATHHPCWTRREPQAEGDGTALFRNAVRYFS